jgi:hypothetical protein
VFEVRLNVKAEQELAELYDRDEETAEQVELLLDALEVRPDALEDEPWPHDQRAAFLTHVGESGWVIAWVHARDRDAVLVGKIFAVPPYEG